jgi:hypothetical protein
MACMSRAVPAVLPLMERGVLASLSPMENRVPAILTLINRWVPAKVTPPVHRFQQIVHKLPAEVAQLNKVVVLYLSNQKESPPPPM